MTSKSAAPAPKPSSTTKNTTTTKSNTSTPLVGKAVEFYEELNNQKHLCNFLRSRQGPKLREAVCMGQRVYYLKGKRCAVRKKRHCFFLSFFFEMNVFVFSLWVRVCLGCLMRQPFFWSNDLCLGCRSMNSHFGVVSFFFVSVVHLSSSFIFPRRFGLPHLLCFFPSFSFSFCGTCMGMV